MGTLYFDTGGSTSNSGTSDNNSADLSGSAATVVTTTVTLDGSPDLSGVSTSGATQAAIYLTDATNSNQKIFWITAVDNTLKTVTVSVAPTGVTSSVWKIGGRMVLTPANWEAAIRANDLVIFNNSPASSATVLITSRVSGEGTNGFIKVKAASSRIALTNSSTGTVITIANDGWWFENIEFIQQGASGNTISVTKVAVFYNCKVSDGGAVGITSQPIGTQVIACEISGVLSHGINFNQPCIIMGNYIHDNGGDGYLGNGANPGGDVLAFNIFDTNAGRGIRYSGATSTVSGGSYLIQQNTIYGNGNSGIEFTDADNHPLMFGNILQNNGDAAGEYNVEWVAGSDLATLHGYNCFNTAAAGGSGNLLGLTTNATEITTDPLFGNAAAGDFTLQSTSPCKGTAYPGAFLGGPTGYLDMGAVQRQESAGAAGVHYRPSMSGNL